VECERNGTLLLLARLSDIGRETARGRFLVGEPVAMRRPAQVPLDPLAGALRTVWADVVSTPLPGHLAALVRRLSVDRERRTLRGGALSGEEQRWGKHNGNVEPY
jgi:hypothetical protein